MLRRSEGTSRRAGRPGLRARAIVPALAAAIACALPTAAEPATSFSIVGRGFGHGVGMSQYGAQGFALHGWDYRRILAHYYPGTTLARAGEARVRVLVRDEAASLLITSHSPIRLTDAGGGRLLLPAGGHELRPELVLALGGVRYRLRAPVRLDPVAAPLSVDGSPYRGSLVVGRGASGLYAIDDVATDDYVRGVVSWEMPSGWSQQALRVQAVAVRSYALAERKPGRLFDLYADTRSQMYGGIRAETAATDAAVAATKGEVLAWHGQIAIAFYSSASGGCTASLSDGMPGAQRLPYLRSVADPYDSISPEHAWGPIGVSSARISGLFGLPDISWLRVERNGSGRVSTVVAGYAGGERAVSGSSFARALGLRSTWFEIDAGAASGELRGCSAHGRRAQLPPPAPRHADPRSWSAPRPSPAPAVAAVQGSRHLPQGFVPALAALLAVMGLLGLALPDRRLLALCLVLAVAGVSAEKWSRSSGRAVAEASRPSGHDESPSAAAAPSPSAPARREPTLPAQPAPPQPASGTPIPTIPEPPPAHPVQPTGPPTVVAPSSPPPPPGKGTPQPAPTPAPPERSRGGAPGRDHPRPTPPPAPPVAPTPPPTIPPPPPPSEALTISDVHVDSAPGSRTLSVSWRTSVAASTVGASASGEQPTVWTAADADATDHRTVFSSLAPSTSYALSLYAVDRWGRQESADLQVATPPATAPPTAQASGGSFLVDGQPFFPIALWALCAGEVDTKLTEGVNLFMTNGCGADQALVDEVAGRALTVVDSKTASAGGGGIVGWNYPDELDNWLPSDATPAMVEAAAPPAPAPTPLLSFLTLTNHFYSYAAPLPQGRGMYPLLAHSADVLGFDLYPMQVWCNADAFAHVYEAQRELVQLAAGKPTYQWIEAAPMEHCPQPELAPTAETVRAETWLAIAGGATAIGYFPNGWTEEIDREIARTDREIRELTPALLAPQTSATSDQPAVKLSTRVLNGAVYVVAVNSSRALVPATINVPELFAGQLEVYDEHRGVPVTNGTFSDVFAPLQVHVYIAGPQLAQPEAPVPAYDRVESPQAPAVAVEPVAPDFGPLLP